MGRLSFRVCCNRASRFLASAFLSSLIPVSSSFAGGSFIVTIEGLNPGGTAQTSEDTFLVTGEVNGFPVVYFVTRDGTGTITTAMQLFPGLPGGSGFGAVADVTSDGTVFGGRSDSPSAPNPTAQEATVWDQLANPQGLGLGAGATDSGVSSISENGIAVGKAGAGGAVMSLSNGVIDLTGTSGGAAGDISDDGMIIGGTIGSVPVLWKATVVGLQYTPIYAEIPPDGVAAGVIRGVSPSGDRVGGEFFSLNELDYVGAIWDSTGLLVHRFGVGHIKAVSDGVVGYNSLVTGISRAYIYYSDWSEPLLLEEHLANLGLDLPAAGISVINDTIRIKHGLNNGLLLVGRATTLGAYTVAFLAYLSCEPGAKADCNGDLAVDLLDHDTTCLTGPRPGTHCLGLPTTCRCLDFDQDGNVDLRDWARFQIEFGSE